MTKTCSIAKHMSQLLDRAQQESFARVLFEITRRAETSLRVVRELLDLEFARKVGGEENTILRENSLCTKFITFYSLHEGTAYLKRLFAPLLADIAATPQAEVDDEWYVVQADAIFSWIREESTMEFMPRSLRAVTASVREFAERYAPDRKYPLMAGYLFLRLYNPCLSSPAAFGLLSDETAPLAKSVQQRTLVLCKALQHLSNNSAPKDNPLLGAWLTEMQPVMCRFLDQVTEDTEYDPPFADQLASSRALRVEDFDPALLHELGVIMVECHAGLEAVRQRLAAAGSSADLVAVYDEMLRDVDVIETVLALSPPRSPRSPRGPSLSSSQLPQRTSPRSRAPEEEAPAAPKRALHRRNVSATEGVPLQRSHSSSLTGKDTASTTMRDKVLGLFNKGGTSSPSLSATAVSSASPAPNTSSSPGTSGSGTMIDWLVDRIDREDLAVCNHIVLFMLLRVYLVSTCSSPSAVAVAKFAANDAISWLEHQLRLPHRGSAVVVLRRLLELQLLSDTRGETAVPQQRSYEDAQFRVHAARFRLWDRMIGKQPGPEHEALADIMMITHHRLVTGGVISQGTNREANLRLDALAAAATGGANTSEQDVETLLVKAAMTMLHPELGVVRSSGGRCELAAATEWLALFGGMSATQSVELLYMFRRHRMVLPPLAAELRDYTVEDAALVLSCVLAASCIQRSRHLKSWNRDSLVALLLGPPHTPQSVAAAFGVDEEDDVRLTALKADEQLCGADEFHDLVRAFGGKGKSKPAEFWVALWRRLEEADFIRLKRMVRHDTPTNALLESHLWFVTSAGSELMLERQSHVFTTFVFDLGDGVPVAAASASTPVASAAPAVPASPAARSGSKSFFAKKRLHQSRDSGAVVSSGTSTPTLRRRSGDMVDSGWTSGGGGGGNAAVAPPPKPLVATASPKKVVVVRSNPKRRSSVKSGPDSFGQAARPTSTGSSSTGPSTGNSTPLGSTAKFHLAPPPTVERDSESDSSVEVEMDDLDDVTVPQQRTGRSAPWAVRARATSDTSDGGPPDGIALKPQLARVPTRPERAGSDGGKITKKG